MNPINEAPEIKRFTNYVRPDPERIDICDIVSSPQ